MAVKKYIDYGVSIEDELELGGILNLSTVSSIGEDSYDILVRDSNYNVDSITPSELVADSDIYDSLTSGFGVYYDGTKLDTLPLSYSVDMMNITIDNLVLEAAVTVDSTLTLNTVEALGADTYGVLVNDSSGNVDYVTPSIIVADSDLYDSLTATYVPYYTGSIFDDSNMSYDSSNGTFGINTTPGSNYLLTVKNEKTNAWSCGLDSSCYSIVTSAGNYRTIGSNYWTQESYLTTQNNIGGLYGMINYALTSRVSGTLSSLYGNQTYYGTYTYFAGQVNSQFGLYIGSYRYGGSSPGTVTNSYDMYIRSPLLNGTPATVTNDWCIYSDHDAPSRLQGSLQIDSDSSGMVLGEGQDAQIYYNGTNLIFDSRLVGTGNFNFTNGTVNISNVPVVGTDPDKFLCWDASGNVDYCTGADLRTYIEAAPALSLTANYLSKAATSTTLSNSIVYENSSKIGIGTTSPQSKLHVWNTGITGTDWVSSITAESLAITAIDVYVSLVSTDAGTWGSGISLKQVGSLDQLYDNSWGIVRKTNDAGSGDGTLHFTYGTNTNITTNTSIMTLQTDGNVGINESAPDSRLEVNGTFHATGEVTLDTVNNPGAVTNILGLSAGNVVQYRTIANLVDDLGIYDNVSLPYVPYFDGGTFVDSKISVYVPTGDIGIGVTSATSLLHLRKDDAEYDAVTYALCLDHTTSESAQNGIGVGIKFRAENLYATIEQLATIEVVNNNAGDPDEEGELIFKVADGSVAGLAEQMRIKYDGVINFSSTPVYADNAAAVSGGLAVGDRYRTSTGTVMEVYS